MHVPMAQISSCDSIGVERGMASFGVMAYADVVVLHEEEHRGCCSMEAFCDQVVRHSSNGKKEVHRVRPWW